MTPLISCLCPDGAPLPLLKEAVLCFTRQTHTSRELLIGVGPDAWRASAIERFVRSLAETGAGQAVVRVVSEVTVSGLAGHARGDLACWWSATASSHPERLAIQAAGLTAASRRACVVTETLRCLPAIRGLYWLGRPTDQPPPWMAATLLAQTSIFGMCADALASGVWPAADLGAALIPGGGLIVNFADNPREEPPLAPDCLAEADARPRLRPLGSALAEHRLPRPLLLRLRAADGGFAVLDPWS